MSNGASYKHYSNSILINQLYTFYKKDYNNLPMYLKNTDVNIHTSENVQYRKKYLN